MNTLINYVKDKEGNDLFIKATIIINENSNVFWFQDVNKSLNIIAKNVRFLSDGIVAWDSMEIDLVCDGIEFSTMPSKVDHLKHNGISVIKKTNKDFPGFEIRRNGSEFPLAYIENSMIDGDNKDVFNVCIYADDDGQSDCIWNKEIKKIDHTAYSTCTSLTNPFIETSIFFATKEYTVDNFEGVAIGQIGAEKPQVFVKFDDEGTLKIIINDGVDDDAKSYEIKFLQTVNVSETKGHRYDV